MLLETLLDTRFNGDNGWNWQRKLVIAKVRRVDHFMNTKHNIRAYFNKQANNVAPQIWNWEQKQYLCAPI